MKKIEKDLQILFERFRDVPDRDPQKEASGRAAFLKQAEALRPRSTQPTQVRHRIRLDPMPPTFLQKVRLPVLSTLLAVILALIVVFGAGATTVYAAQSSLPDSALYPLKTFSEDALLSLTVSPQAKLDLTLDFTDRRLGEIASLQSAGQPIPQKVMDRYQGELDQALQLAAGLDDPMLARSLEQLSLHSEGQLKQLADLVNANPRTPDLLQLHARLQEQVQAVELGKSDPQGFRQKVQDQFLATPGNTSTEQNEQGQPKNTPGAPARGKDSGEYPPDKTPGPGGQAGKNDKPTPTPKSDRHHGPGNPGGNPDHRP